MAAEQTITPAMAAKELLARRKANESLIAFTRYRMPNYIAAPHHDLICAKLEAVERGEIKRLMIYTPPRHGKSEIASRSFPAWFLGRNPTKQIIACSYNTDLASDFGRNVRDIVKSQEFINVFDKTTLSADDKSAGKWRTSQGGIYVSAGVGSGITGRGADILLIDDPVKDRTEAESPTVRKKIWDWYTSTAYTRLMPGGAVILIQTRWHTDDLGGRLLREMDKGSGDRFEIVNLPALQDDLSPLWPEAYPLDRLLNIKRTIGTRDWQALYQQDPAGDDKAGFQRDWLKYWYADNFDNMNIYLFCDPANAKKITSDYTVFAIIGIGEDDNYYLIDLIRDRLNLTERCEMLFKLHKKYNPKKTYYERYGIQADIQHFEYVMALQNYRFTINEVAGQTSKNDRISRLIPIFEAGRFYIPQRITHIDYQGEPQEIIKNFIEDEFMTFPVSVHDDMLDCMARVVDPAVEVSVPVSATSIKSVEYSYHQEQQQLQQLSIEGI